MTKFLRQAFRLLDRGARIRLALLAIGSVGVAILEAIALSLIVPLISLLLDEQRESLPTAARFIGRFISIETPGEASIALAVLVLVALTVKAVAAISLLRWGIGNLLAQEARISRRLFSLYLTAPTAYHLGHHSAEVQRTLNESMTIVFQRSLPFLAAAAADALTLVAVVVVLVVSDLPVALLAIVYFSLVAVVYQRWIGGRHKVAARKIHREVVVRYRQVQEAMLAVRELAVLHREDHFVERFYQTKLDLAESRRRVVFYQLLPRQFLDLAFVLGAAAVATLLFATRSTPEALASIGLFLTASFRLLSPLNRVMNATTVTRTAEPALEQILHDLEVLGRLHSDKADESKGAVGPAPLVLTDVSFRYGDDLPDVLERVSLQIEPGDDVGIVGATGAGKSTLLYLLLGLLDPSAGEITVGGRKLPQCRTDWQLSIGYVPQDVVLIDDSVRANVAFGIDARDIDDDRVWEALRLAHVDPWVSALPEGLDSQVGEGGVRVSGGQRQRLGIARALYHRPSVLVLDEATSSLDTHTEAQIIDTVTSLRRMLTMITVSHRLSTLQHCDRVYFLRGGEMAAVGTFDELRANEPDFARLATLAELTPG